MSIPELMSLAREHWEKWLPEKVKELRAEGSLQEAIHGAASLAQTEIDHLMKYQGYREHEAREVALPVFILLRPESSAEMSAEERRDHARAESQHRKKPPV
jgi:hypothetical protein